MDWLPEDPNTCLRLADAVVALHFALVAFIVLGELLILAGALLRWAWIRNRWFRAAHVLTMTVVALQSAFDVLCPLTTLENDLRARAGRPIEQASFVGRWLHELLFVDLDFRLLTWIYVGFGALVLATLFLVPPRWRPRPLPGGGTPRSDPQRERNGRCAR